jgi:hypothetical protein
VYRDGCGIDLWFDFFWCSRFSDKPLMDWVAFQYVEREEVDELNQ